MPIKGFSFFSSSGHFVQWNKTILEILVEGYLMNISVKSVGYWPTSIYVV